jgi:hypothetical protein
MGTSLKRFKKNIIKNKAPPILMPGTTNLMEDCSHISVDGLESSVDTSHLKNIT